MSGTDEPERVVVPTARVASDVFHLPDPEADGETAPKCHNDKPQSGREWRSVPRDHSAVADRRLCERCGGTADTGRANQAKSLRQAIADGEVDA